MSFTYKKKSFTSNVFSIEGVGIVYASKTKVRINVAATTAKAAASIHSRAVDFCNFYHCIPA